MGRMIMFFILLLVGGSVFLVANTDDLKSVAVDRLQDSETDG